MHEKDEVSLGPQQSFPYIYKKSLSLCWLFYLVNVLQRWLVSLGSYSGFSSPPMYGDFEAQRHWMEITRNLPIAEWYHNTTKNDLMYWGLDYPPLTAFVSYAFGSIMQYLDADMIALGTSRGYETLGSKSMMRSSVILADLLVLFPAVYYCVSVMYRSELRAPAYDKWRLKTLTAYLILSQPSFLLIDHGHFQYNNISLGLTAAAVALIYHDHDFLASVAYCLALNFKQMTLYFAPAFGLYLLSKCCYGDKCILHLIKLSAAVVVTIGLLWLPFCLYRPPGSTCLSSWQQSTISKWSSDRIILIRSLFSCTSHLPSCTWLIWR